MSANRTIIADNLLDWYDRHARELPWRTGPTARLSGQMPDPYRVWLSEIMLQQTTVATVKDYFARFTRRWPTVQALAAASEDDILKEWAGLGYYSRARNLKKCADRVVADYNGAFPADEEKLRALPGIGDYTAAAIASIAFDIPSPVVDGNVERVFTRLFAIDTPLPKAKVEIKARVGEVLADDRPGDFAQACMDLGATICTPKRPACMHCPLRGICTVLGVQDPELFPVKPPKKEKPNRLGAVFVVTNEEDEVLLEKRPGTGLLANMSQAPTTDWNSRKNGAVDVRSAPIPKLQWVQSGEIDHVFTHFALTLTVWKTQIAKTQHLIGKNQWWSPIQTLDEEALPTVMKKAIACALPEARLRGNK
ncbi:MAG: A/G-specific adenine glycosylase [Pseudomonadota bacterium]